MHVVHCGFDTLDLAIEANISDDLLAALNEVREAAEENQSPVPFQFGGGDFDVLPHGVPGYRFALKCGPLGANWFFKKPNPRDRWGVRLSIGSTFLATQGLGAARAYIDTTLNRLGIRFEAHQVSIARADFCVDILAPGFALTPENFVIHSHANRADHLSATDDVTTNGNSGRYTSVTIGKMPGRQVIIYDKRREVIDKRKPLWWDIWNGNLVQASKPPLDPTDAATSRVWRIEVRAGKKLLKDRWHIRRWAEFDALFGDVVAEAFGKVRYTVPDPADSNRARWQNAPIWDVARQAASGDLLEMRSYVEPDRVKLVHQEEHKRLIFSQLLGIATTSAALNDVRSKELPDFLANIGSKLKQAANEKPERVAAKLKEAKGRYRFSAA